MVTILVYTSICINLEMLTVWSENMECYKVGGKNVRPVLVNILF